MITKFNFNYFKSDLLSGITAAIVALPLCLAFGISAVFVDIIYNLLIKFYLKKQRKIIIYLMDDLPHHYS